MGYAYFKKFAESGGSGNKSGKRETNLHADQQQNMKKKSSFFRGPMVNLEEEEFAN